MKLRFGYFTDLHLYDRNIRTRMDNSSEAALNKLAFIVRTAIDTECHFLFSGGDLFEDKIDSPEYLAAIIRILMGAPNFHSVVGNHDILHRVFENFMKRNMAVLEASAAVRILSDQLLDYGILGISAFNEGIVQKVLESGRGNDVRIIFAHHFLNHGRDRLVVNVEGLKVSFPNLSAIFTGHDHSEYPTVVSHGVTLVRPGGALRTSSAKENTNRQPKMLVVDYDSEATPCLDIHEVLLPCLAGDVIFDLSVKEVNKSVDETMEEFSEGLAQVSYDGIDLEKVLNEKIETVKEDEDLHEYLMKDRSIVLSA